MLNWETIVAIFGALGGLEGFKWLTHRKANKRIKFVESALTEFHMLKETVEFLQGQLKDKEKQFADNSALVLNLNAEILQLTKEKGELELELAKVRCNDLTCPYRQPPTPYTLPDNGLLKEMYYKNKNSNETLHD